MTHNTMAMRTAMACLLLAGSTASAAPLFLEGFDGTRWPPTSWQISNAAGTPATWNLNSTWGDVNYTGCTGAAAMISSAGAPRYSYNCTLSSTYIQLPAAATALELRFATVLETWSGDETADVDISSDLGVTWTNAFRWKAVDHLEGQQAVSLMPYLGKYIRVRFHYYNTINQAWDLYWQIDDFRIVVPLAGDVNKDDTVDVIDLLTLIDAFGSATGQTNYNPACDFNGDGTVDVLDLLDMVGNFGQSS